MRTIGIAARPERSNQLTAPRAMPHLARVCRGFFIALVHGTVYTHPSVISHSPIDCVRIKVLVLASRTGLRPGEDPQPPCGWARLADDRALLRWGWVAG